MAAISRACKGLAVIVAGNVEEIFVAIGLALIVVGLKQVWAPGAYIAPGLVLLWIFLPARTGFIVTPKSDDKKGRT